MGGTCEEKKNKTRSLSLNPAQKSAPNESKILKDVKLKLLQRERKHFKNKYVTGKDFVNRTQTTQENKATWQVGLHEITGKEAVNQVRRNLQNGKK